MNLSYKQGNSEMLYLGLGIPFWLYLFISYSKWINKTEVNQNYFTIKNIVSKKQTIEYKDIEQWEVIQTIRVSQQNLLIRVNGKKLIISNMVDTKNYEILRHRLKTHWSELEKTKS